MEDESIKKLTFEPALPRGWSIKDRLYVREDILQVMDTFPKIPPNFLQYSKDNKTYYYYDLATKRSQWSAWI